MDPTLTTELELARPLGRDAVVVGIDEVGRGAIAGPVVIGACALLIRGGATAVPLPAGVRDSKALSAARREALVEPLRSSVHAHALGWASPAEIDEHGILPALTLAATRAIAAIPGPIDAIIMDGSVDVITPALLGLLDPVPPVRLQVKADRDCLSVAAASVLAKAARDAHMVQLAEAAPDYGWAQNKGYASAVHREALRTRGLHEEHRRSWNLVGAPAAPAADARPASASPRPDGQVEPDREPGHGMLPGVLWESLHDDAPSGTQEAQQ